jgi:hypothetical protein
MMGQQKNERVQSNHPLRKVKAAMDFGCTRGSALLWRDEEEPIAERPKLGSVFRSKRAIPKNGRG